MDHGRSYKSDKLGQGTTQLIQAKLVSIFVLFAFALQSSLASSPKIADSNLSRVEREQAL